MSDPSPIVLLQDVSKWFHNPDGQVITILHDLSLSIKSGQTIGITGTSGCGKSTLLNIIGGLDKPSSGTVFWEGKCISTLSMDQIALLRQSFIGFIFQGSNLIPEITVLENILFPVRIAQKKLSNYRDQAQQLLEKLDIMALSNRVPMSLSGGERQRVAIARALVLNPELVIADEPTGNLDEKNAVIVIELLAELCHENHTSLLLVTHNIAFAKKMQNHYALTSNQLQRVN